MPLAKLSSKSQIVLPAEIRRELAINPGDLLEVVTEKEAIVIRKAPFSFVEALQECTSPLWQGYESELEKSRDQWDG